MSWRAARGLALVLLVASVLASPWWVSRLPAARTTPLPWRGTLARRFWLERAAGRLECRWRRPEYGWDLPYPPEWLRNALLLGPAVPDTTIGLGPADSAMPLRHRVPTHAIYDCMTRVELQRSVQPLVMLSIRDGWVTSYRERWSVPAATGAALFDSLHAELAREYGPSRTCVDRRSGGRWRRVGWSTPTRARHIVLTRYSGDPDAGVPIVSHDLMVDHDDGGSCLEPAR